MNWKDLSIEMNRKTVDCQRKWKSILDAQMRHDPYTETENNLIRQRVKEWGNKGKGLWTSIEREIDRSQRSLELHWDRVLSKCN